MKKKPKLKFHIDPNIEVKSDGYLPITMIWHIIKRIFKRGK